MSIKRYEDLEVWKTAHQALLNTYRITKTHPSDERFLLVSQMRRAAMSITANIVEGFGRRRANDKIRFYNISQASAEELSYFYRVSRDLGYLNEYVEVGQLLNTVARMLKKLIQKTPELPFLP